MKNKYKIITTTQKNIIDDEYAKTVSVNINGTFSVDEIEYIYDEMLQALGGIKYCPICGIEFGYGHRTDCTYTMSTL